MSASTRLGRDEAVAQIDAELAALPAARHPEVLAWTLWGLGPWSSVTDYARVVHDLLWERHRDALEAEPRVAALAQLALARTFLGDRAYRRARSVLEGAEVAAQASGLGTLTRARRALLARTALQTGNLQEAFGLMESVSAEDIERDPPAFRAEAGLGHGLVALVQGRLQEAGQALVEVGTWARAHERSDLGAWQVARAAIAQAHVMFRANLPAEAQALGREALGLAAESQAIREGAEWTLLTAAYGLACAEVFDATRVQAALVAMSSFGGAGGGLDVASGLPLDLSGATEPAAALARTREAAEERRRNFDPAGQLLVTLVAVAIGVACEDGAGARDALDRLDASGPPDAVAALASRARSTL